MGPLAAGNGFGWKDGLGGETAHLVLLTGERSPQSSQVCGSISIPMRAVSHSGAAAPLPVPPPSPAAA